MLDFALARRAMIDNQLRPFDVNDLTLLGVLEDVPRERFVPTRSEAFAYSDRELPVSDGLDTLEKRVMPAPMIWARLVQALGIRSGERALDVACGLGYSSVVLARLGCSVMALEMSAAMADAARARLAAVGVGGVEVVTGPLEKGYPQRAPYDVILVNGSVEVTPQTLLGQLADGGRLVCVQGRGLSAKGIRYIRSGNAFGCDALFNAFAPPLMAFRQEPGFVF